MAPVRVEEKVKVKEKLIAAGVDYLQAFGYRKCTKNNILTNKVYSGLFEDMLKGCFGIDIELDKAIDELLTIIDRPD